jgi:hypothetical protein
VLRAQRSKQRQDLRDFKLQFLNALQHDVHFFLEACPHAIQFVALLCQQGQVILDNLQKK